MSNTLITCILILVQLLKSKQLPRDPPVVGSIQLLIHEKKLFRFRLLEPGLG